jgi:anti-anti-sigma factor
MTALNHETRAGYHILFPENLNEDEVDGLIPLVEKLLMEKQQDVVLSLALIDSVFSVHLTAFIQLYKLLKNFRLKFILVDLSPAVLNVLQMTHLENLLSLYLSVDDFTEELEQRQVPEISDMSDLSFKYQIQQEDDFVVVQCEGHMTASEELFALKKELEQDHTIILDLKRIGYMDNHALIVIGGLASQANVTIRKASNVIIELLELNQLLHRVVIEEDDLEGNLDS